MFATATSFLISLLILLPLCFILFRNQLKPSTAQAKQLSFLQFYRRLYLPALVTFLFYAAYSTLLILPLFLDFSFIRAPLYTLISTTVGVTLLVSLYTLTATFIRTIDTALQQQLIQRKANRLVALIPLFSKGFKLAIALILLNATFQLIGIPHDWRVLLVKLSRVTVIGMIGWFLLQVVHTVEILFIQHNHAKFAKDLDSRKAYTHISILKRIMITLITILTVSAMLMNFESIRAIGTTALASAGLLVTVISFSAKGLLESIFKGMQIAITQPIRVNDTILIEGESGVVDSINLHHVSITLWNKRQIIVPTGYFLDKPFQNWTHHSNDLLDNIFFYISYHMPIEPIRRKFEELLAQNPLWNKQASGFYVHGFKDRMVELRLVVSANDSNNLSKLRYEIREKLLDYMQENHPEGIPNTNLIIYPNLPSADSDHTT